MVEQEFIDIIPVKCGNLERAKCSNVTIYFWKAVANRSQTARSVQVKSVKTFSLEIYVQISSRSGCSTGGGVELLFTSLIEKLVRALSLWQVATLPLCSLAKASSPGALGSVGGFSLTVLQIYLDPKTIVNSYNLTIDQPS